jgi:hypothetical protein
MAIRNPPGHGRRGSRPATFGVTQKNLGVSNHAVVLERGAVVHAAASAALLNDRAALETHLGVTDASPRRFGRKRDKAAR